MEKINDVLSAVETTTEQVKCCENFVKLGSGTRCGLPHFDPCCPVFFFFFASDCQAVKTWSFQ
jgi:hypothetical protein